MTKNHFVLSCFFCSFFFSHRTTVSKVLIPSVQRWFWGDFCASIMLYTYPPGKSHIAVIFFNKNTHKISFFLVGKVHFCSKIAIFKRNSYKKIQTIQFGLILFEYEMGCRGVFEIGLGQKNDAKMNEI